MPSSSVAAASVVKEMARESIAMMRNLPEIGLRTNRNHRATATTAPQFSQMTDLSGG